MNKKSVLAILLFAATGVAHAADDTTNYYGVSLAELSSGTNSPDHAPTGLMLRLGHRFSYDFSMEFHTGSAQTTSTLSIDRINSVLLRWSAPYENFHLYTLVGMSRIVYSNSGTQAVADSGSFGLGAQFDTRGPYTIHLEWVSYGTSATLKADAINLGFERNF